MSVRLPATMSLEVRVNLAGTDDSIHRWHEATQEALDVRTPRMVGAHRS
jgi:hypothetical protein